jgi:hypothetical protein
MARKRGSAHTTLTETATAVVRVLEKMPGIKMIAPGIIDARRSGPRHITVIHTSAGFELLISGQGVQKVAVHLVDTTSAKTYITALKESKSLRSYHVATRVRKPGI